MFPVYVRSRCHAIVQCADALVEQWTDREQESFLVLAITAHVVNKTSEAIPAISAHSVNKPSEAVLLENVPMSSGAMSLLKTLLHHPESVLVGDKICRGCGIRVLGTYLTRR